MLAAGDRAGAGIGWECLGPGCVSEPAESRATAKAVEAALVAASKESKAAVVAANKESKAAKRKQREDVRRAPPSPSLSLPLPLPLRRRGCGR